MVLAHDIYDGHRTQDIQIKEDITFESILLADKTLSGLKKAGFYKPSPIQLHGIPLGKCGFDLLLEAKSGTGKTAVFTVIALEKIDLKKGLQVLMLAPTREIAAQICNVIKEIGSDYSGLNVEVVMGGLPVQEDIAKFKSKLVHIVVGSPGRLKHLILDKHIDVNAVRLVVLDECDKLMEKSFFADINVIFSILPHQRQVIMSSATYPEKCKSFINKYVQNAHHICPNTSAVLLGITQKVTLVKKYNNIVKQTQKRFEELDKILTTMQFKQCLIFCNYQARVAELHKMLTKSKWPVELLYGQQEQNDRLDALRYLQEYKCRILISTDLAARGIDASNVDLIINFEPPFEWQTYLHRIGRAGRYGSYGIAITILSEGQEATKFKELFDTINLPLDLRNLWTDDEFHCNIKNSLQTPVLDITDLSSLDKKKTLGQMSKELWEILTFEKETDREVTQSFEELQRSYELTCSSHNNNIESFDDLLTSFKQSENIEKDDIKYKCVTFPKKSINDYLIRIKNENMTKEMESSNITHPEKSTTTPLLENKGEQNQNYDISLQFTKDINNKCHVKDPTCINNHKTNTTAHKEGNKNINKYQNDCDTDNVKALLEAGLPTSFGKKYNNSVSKLYTPNNKVIKEVVKKNQELLHNKHYVHSKVDKVPCNSNLKSPPHKTNIGFVNKHRNCDKFSRNFSNKISLQSHLKDKLHNSNSQAEQYKHDIKCYYNYNIWFNHLKANMTYIEYVVYNNEISKL